jgi:hypothetical protein
MARDHSRAGEVLPRTDGNAVGRVKAFVRVRPLRTMEVAVPWALTQCNAHEWAFHPKVRGPRGPPPHKGCACGLWDSATQGSIHGIR